MRKLTLVIPAAVLVSACASPLERQAGPASQSACWEQAKSYVRANMATIANEWRELERYKYYQRCLAESKGSTS